MEDVNRDHAGEPAWSAAGLPALGVGSRAAAATPPRIRTAVKLPPQPPHSLARRTAPHGWCEIEAMFLNCKVRRMARPPAPHAPPPGGLGPPTPTIPPPPHHPRPAPTS